MLPSTKRNVSASASSRISWLNPAPHALVVYASPQPSPADVQHSLPGGRYPLPGRDFHPLEHASFSWRTRFFIPAHARCTRRAEIGSRRAAGPRVAAHSGLDAIEHGASLRSGRVSSLPDHSSFRDMPAKRSRNMAIRKAGAPNVPGAVTALCGPPRRKRSHRASSRQGHPPALSRRNCRRLRRGRATHRNQSRDHFSRRHA